MKFSVRGIAGSVVTAVFATIIILVVWGNVYVTNQLTNRNQPAVSIVPGSPIKGDKGEKGDKGDRPTAQEVQQAVTDYCASTGSCEGKNPSVDNVYAAVARFCENNVCRGEVGAAGVNGQDAAPVTDEQLQAQVVAYCAAHQCIGANGSDGLPGTAGQSPVMACVIRTTTAVETRYVAWKYQDEADDQYRDLYKLPVWAECQQPVDLREAA